MTVLSKVDLEFERYLDKIELCDIQTDRKGGCSRIATHELLVRCRKDHEYSVLSCEHHKIIACASGMACRMCRAENDSEWLKWAVRVVAIWERSAK